MSIIYFIPSAKRAASPEDAVAAGLDYALDGQGVVSTRVEEGPGKLPGLVIAAQGPGADVSYRPADQNWKAAPGGKYWAGLFVENHARPGPQQLARAKQYEGTPVRLLDGNEWIIPRCVGLLASRPSTLPRVLDLDDSGNTITKAHPRYAALCEKAFTWWLQFSNSAGATPLTAEQQVDLAVAGLTVNYRIGKVEAISLLSLFGTDELGRVLRAMIDADEIEAHFNAAAEKKSTGAPSDSST